MKQFALFLAGAFYLAAFSPLPAFGATAGISNLVFTSPIRTALPGVTSESIVVQTENSSGEAEPVDETNDVTFHLCPF